MEYINIFKIRIEGIYREEKENNIFIRYQRKLNMQDYVWITEIIR